MEFNTISILGIPFIHGKVEDVFAYLNEKGGLLTVPAAPNLATIPKDKLYYKSLLESDIVIPDSGLMVLMWKLISFKPINKISGLLFMNHFLDCLSIVEQKKIFLINPNEAEGEINRAFLNKRGLNITKDNIYAAPYYEDDSIEDAVLLSKIQAQRPHWIMINIGGGVQEKLGLFLKESLSYAPAILCTGAAIAFKTGSQINIPNWADKFYLGWFYRCLSNPKLYVSRYTKGFKLVIIMLKYQSKIAS